MNSNTNRNTPSPRAARFARLTGLLTGAGLAVFLVSSWSVPAGTGIAGAEVSMLANLSGELSVTPAGRPFLRDGDLTPGESLTGEVVLLNQTPARLWVRMRARADSPELDRVLHVEVSSGKARAYRGPLGGLREFIKEPFSIDAGAKHPLSVRAWLPRGAGKRSGNRAAETTFEFRSKPAEG